MAVYYCHSCGNYVDDDYHPMDDEGTCPTCVENHEEERDMDLLEQFKTEARRASFNYADDSCKEWGSAKKHVAAAMEVYSENPGLRTEMRVIVKGELWGGTEFEMERARIYANEVSEDMLLKTIGTKTLEFTAQLESDPYNKELTYLEQSIRFMEERAYGSWQSRDLMHQARRDAHLAYKKRA